ncbi:MAG: prolipoprotein diacylglyceryl transferase, partial [Proteobacteria bacterium]|nr:prolipoprotein diacylglyceryl transferase [Pseudomonadota bacterium]
GFIRIGNFFNSEIIGLTTNVPWAIIFASVDNLPRHPTQLYESFGYFYIGISFYLIYHFKQAKIGEGRMFGAVMTSGFLYRMFIELFKERHVAFEQNLFMSMGQILSVPFIVLGLYLLFGFHRKSRLWSWAMQNQSVNQQEKLLKSHAGTSG